MLSACPYWHTGGRKAGLAAEAIGRDAMGTSPPLQYLGENKGGKKELLLATHLSHRASLEPCMECAHQDRVACPPALSAASEVLSSSYRKPRLRKTEVEEAGFKPSCVGSLVAREQCLFRFVGL